MKTDVGAEIAALGRMTPKELRQKYTEVFGETTNGRNRAWLVKRIAWRIQANAEGGLSERARLRAAELASDADIRMTPPRSKSAAPAEDRLAVRVLPFGCDGRLPPPGTVLTRKYKDGVVQVKVLADGFEHDGRVYRSLSAVAKAVTGSHCNGFLFFHLVNKEGEK